jgi:FkbM family methyltransferase
MLVRRCLNLGSQIKVKRDGISWNLDLDEGIDLSIFLFGCFEPSTTQALKRLVKPGQTVLDVGANIGAHTLTLARLVGTTGRVIAFEPTNYAFDKASKNIKLNPTLAKSIKLEQILLSEYDDHAVPGTLYSSWPLVGDEKLHEKHCGLAKGTSGASATTLDEYLLSHNIGKVHFIKLDVDGYECKVLRGASELLKKQKPVIVMELCPYVLKEHGETLEELVRILDLAGYRLYEETTEKELPLDPGKLDQLVPDASGINVVAR